MIKVVSWWWVLRVLASSRSRCCEGVTILSKQQAPPSIRPPTTPLYLVLNLRLFAYLWGKGRLTSAFYTLVSVIHLPKFASICNRGVPVVNWTSEEECTWNKSHMSSDQDINGGPWTHRLWNEMFPVTGGKHAMHRQNAIAQRRCMDSLRLAFQSGIACIVCQEKTGRKPVHHSRICRHSSAVCPEGRADSACSEKHWERAKAETL